MKIKTILLLLIGTMTVSGIAQDILWQKTLGGKHAELLNDAIATPDYGFFLAGSSLSKEVGKLSKKNAGDFDYYIVKLNEQGEIEYSNLFGGSGTDHLKSIQRTKDGGMILIGTSNSPISGDKTTPHLGRNDIWLVKLDIYGNIQWQKTLGGVGEDRAELVLLTQDGGYLIGASSSSNVVRKEKADNCIYKTEKSRGNLDYWLVKLQEDGSLEWQKTLGGKYVDQIRSIIELPQGGFVVGGVSNSPQAKDKDTKNEGFNDWWLLSLDSEGFVNWQQSYATEADDQLYSIVYTKDDALLVGGSVGKISKEKEQIGSDFLLLKLNLDGEELWKKTFDYGDYDIMSNLVQNKDHSFLLSGYVTNTNKSLIGSKVAEDYLVIKLDEKGNKKWQKNIGSRKKEVLKQSIETRDGGYVLLGTKIKKEAKNKADFWIVKLKDLDKKQIEKEQIEALPNPVQNATTLVLGYDYEKGSVRVVDMNGRIIQQFDIHGERMIPVNTKTLQFGVYIIHVKTDVQENSTKIIKGR